MATTDDWGGVLIEDAPTKTDAPVTDDWGGIALDAPEPDDWGGIPIADETPTPALVPNAVPAPQLQPSTGSGVVASPSPDARQADSAGQQPVNPFADFFARVGQSITKSTMDTAAGALKVVDDARVVGPLINAVAPNLLSQTQAVADDPNRPAALRVGARALLNIANPPAIQAGQSLSAEISEEAKSVYPSDPSRDENLSSVIASGIGSILPTIASGGAAPLTTGLMMGESGRQDAEKFGATAGQQDAAFYFNAAVGTITEQLLGIPALMRAAQAKKIPEATLRSIVGRAALQATKQSAREGTQEGLEQAMGNVIASDIASYDPNRPITQGVGQAALAGAIIGAPVGGITQAATDIDTLRATAPLTAQALVESEPPSGTTPVAPEGPALSGEETPPANLSAASSEMMLRDFAERLSPKTFSFNPSMDWKASAHHTSGSGSRETIIGLRGATVTEAKATILHEAGHAISEDGVPNELLPLSEKNEYLAEEVKAVKWAVDHAVENGLTEQDILGVVTDNKVRESYDEVYGADSAQKVVAEPSPDAISGDATAVTETESAQPIPAGEQTTDAGNAETIPATQGSAGRDEALVRAYEIAQRIGEQTASGQSDSVREAATIAAFRNAQQSIEKTGQFNPDFMTRNAMRAAGVAKGREAQSLDAPVGDGDTTVGDLLPDDNDAPDVAAMKTERIQQANEALASLDEQERAIVRMHTIEDMTLDEIAEELGMSRQNVGRIHTKALKTLKARVSEISAGVRKPTAAPTPAPAPQAQAASQQQSRGPSASGEDTQTSGARLGPGAANIEEPVARYEERKFGVRFGEDKAIATEIRDATGNRYYEVLPNRVTAEEATTLISEMGRDEAVRLIRDEQSAVTPAVRATIGQVVIKQLNEEYRAAKESDPGRAEAALNQAVDLAEWQMELGTRLGQGVQSFAMWSRLTPEGKLRSYKRSVDKVRTRVKQQLGEEIEEILDTVNTDETDAVKRKNLTALAKKNGTAKKVRKKFDRILAAARDGRLSDEKFFEEVSDVLGLPPYNEQTAKTIISLAGDVDAAAEGIPRTDATKKLMDFITSQRGFDASDLPLGIYYGNILSGYNTQIVNALDTGLNVISEITNMAIANPRAAADVMRGFIRGFGEGNSDAILSLTEGRRVSDVRFAEQPFLMEQAKFGEKGGVPISTATRTGRVLKRAAESKVAKPLNLYKYVSRLMAASDAVWFRSAEEARAALLAYRAAEATGAKKDGLRAEADKILGYDRIDEFRKQAESEGFTGARADARVTELMQQARPEALREESADFAGLSTYNHDPEGLLGMFSRDIGKWTQRIPALRVVVPFVRIVANVTNRGLNYTPLGYKRALAGYSGGDGPLTGDARTAMLAKATAGTAGLALLGILDALGVAMVHGGGPSDDERNKQLRATGWKPYSIQIGDTYISYLPTPLGLGLSSLGNYLDSNRYQELKQKDALTRAAYSISRIPSTIFNQSFLSGLSGLFEALSSRSPGQQISALKKILTRTASGFTVPNIARDINRLFDPTYRDSDSIAEDLIRDIPVARLGLRQTLNAFGETIAPPSNRFVSVRKSDPEWRLVAEKGIRVPVADDTVFTEPEAGYLYQKLAGEGMKKYIRANSRSLSSQSPDKAQESVTRASASIFSEARARVRSRYPTSLRQRGKSQ